MEANPADIFSRWAHLYDAIYARKGKDYHAECRELASIVDEFGETSGGPPDGRSWADLACGTGEHLARLAELGIGSRFVGLDRNPSMLEVARNKVPRAQWIRGDLRHLPLGARQSSPRFHVVTCLFASIGYLPSPQDIRRCLQDMTRLLVPGGVLIVEPPVSMERLQPPAQSTLWLEFEGQLVRRTTSAVVEDGALLVRFELTAGLRSWTETHRILLLPEAFIGECLEGAGVEVLRRPGTGPGLGVFAGRRRSG